MANVDQTDVATADVREIVRRLRQLSRPAAKKFTESLWSRYQHLANSPRLGRARPEFGEGIRTLVIGSYIAIYHATDETVTILRVVHGTRDLISVWRATDW